MPNQLGSSSSLTSCLLSASVLFALNLNKFLFDRTTGTIRFTLNKTSLRRWRKEGRKEGREGCLALRGTLAVFLGCCTSYHCWRFPASPMTHHIEWERSSPAEQDHLARQLSKNSENGAVLVFVGSSADMSSSVHKACVSVLSSYRVICAWAPIISETWW